MRRTLLLSISAFLFFALQTSTRAQDLIVPAGTLLHCTLDEPNFSSATASVGDPVVCHLDSLQEWGHIVFPRGSYLGGHLEADKDPGHFVGKGYLKLEFDRIGLPTTEIPVPSKVIAARGFRVDKQGDVVGHGHATRDTVEWLFPPLWPWKVVSLPARGPRPALKGEEQLTLRLMDDISVPRSVASLPSSWHYFGESSGVYARPQSYSAPQTGAASVARISTISFAPGMDNPQNRPARMTQIALKSNVVFAVRSYHVNSGEMSYVLMDGAQGSVDSSEVDWRATSQLNASQNQAPSVAARSTY
jgi:hypothetical protein